MYLLFFSCYFWTQILQYYLADISENLTARKVKNQVGRVCFRFLTLIRPTGVIYDPRVTLAWTTSGLLNLAFLQFRSFFAIYLLTIQCCCLPYRTKGLFFIQVFVLGSDMTPVCLLALFVVMELLLCWGHKWPHRVCWRYWFIGVVTYNVLLLHVYLTHYQNNTT